MQGVTAGSVAAVIDRIERAYQHEETVFVIGNGGSAAAASHFAQDLAKGTICDQSVSKRIKALSLTDNMAYLTALGNDNGYQEVFAAQLRTFARRGDVLVAISVSGTSPNILEGVNVARAVGVDVVAVTGAAASPLRAQSQYEIAVPTLDVGMVEGAHSVVLHYVTTALRRRLEAAGSTPVEATVDK
jgi:D-sedoheptulose 7-phosphate isomerase